MKKDKNFLEYDEEVKQIRAMALYLIPGKLSVKSLSWAILISKNGRQVLAEKMRINEYLLRKISVDIPAGLKDDPAKKWPKSFFKEKKEAEEDLDFDSLLASLDDQKAQNKAKSKKNRVEITNLGLLADKLLEIRGREFFYKHSLANKEKEFLTLVRKAKGDVQDKFPGNIKQIEELYDLIRMQYLKNYSSGSNTKMNPVFIFSTGDNEEYKILEYVSRNLGCQIEFFDLESNISTDFRAKLKQKLPVMAVFQMSGIIIENENLGALLTYFETGKGVELEDNDGLSLFSDKVIDLKKLIEHNILLFLIKIPDGLVGWQNITNEELVHLMIDFYYNKYQDARYVEQITRLLKLVRNYNSVLFNDLKFRDVDKIIKRQLLSLGGDPDSIPGETFALLVKIIVVLGGNLKVSSLRDAIDYFLTKADITPLGLRDITFEIDCKLDYLKNIFSQGKNISSSRAYEFQQIIENLKKSNKWVSFKISSQKRKKIIVLNDFKEYSTPHDNTFLQERPSIRFKDVIGLTEIKERFKTIRHYYKNPEAFGKLKVVPNNRVLLTGNPGTGKTLIAKAFAGEMGLPFFYISASELTSQKYAGYGGSLLRQIFQTAKGYQPCILFIDELDTIGNRDKLGDDSVAFDAKSIINTLLVELDGINTQYDIIVVGATNRPQDIDPALTRPKRFGTILNTDNFTTSDRRELIKLKLKPEMCSEPFDSILKIFIDRTNNDFTPAIIEEIINEAKLLAINDNREKLTFGDIHKAIDNLVLGHKISEVDPSLKGTMAFHQTGHALLYRIFFPEKKIEKLSVSVYQNSIGLLQIKKEDNSLVKQYPIDELIKIMVVQMGGPVCEELKFGSWGLMAEDDWEFVSMIAAKIVGNIVVGKSLKPIIEYYLSPDIITDSNSKLIEQLIDFCYQTAKSSLQENRIDVELLAEKLIDKGELLGSEIDYLLTKVTLNDRNLFEDFKRSLLQ